MFKFYKKYMYQIGIITLMIVVYVLLITLTPIPKKPDISTKDVICEVNSETVNVKDVKEGYKQYYLVIATGEGGSWDLETDTETYLNVMTLLKEGPVTATREKNNCWFEPDALTRIESHEMGYAKYTLDEAYKEQKNKNQLTQHWSKYSINQLKDN